MYIFIYIFIKKKKKRGDEPYASYQKESTRLCKHLLPLRYVQFAL